MAGLGAEFCVLLVQASLSLLDAPSLSCCLQATGSVLLSCPETSSLCLVTPCLLGGMHCTPGPVGTIPDSSLIVIGARV